MSPKAKPRNRLRERLWTLLFTLLVTLVFGSGVSFVHVVTQDRVRVNEALFLRRAVRAATGLPKVADTELPAWFDSAVTVLVTNSHYRVEAPKDKEPPVDVFIRSGAGLWGRIEAAVGVTQSDDGPALAGVAFLDQNETPGLGARITEEWFTTQVRGKRGTIRLVAEDTRSEAPDEIDAITGATVTSTAVRDIFNRVLSQDAATRSATERSAPDGQDERR